MGDIKKAILLVEESASLDRKTGNLGNLAYSMLALGEARLDVGEWDKSEQTLSEALKIALELKQHQQMAGVYRVLGLFSLDKGEYAKAKEMFEKAIEISEKAGDKIDEMSQYPILILACAELGEIDTAARLLDSLDKFVSETGDKGFIAPVNVARGSLFRAQRKWDDSIRCFEKSLQESEALGARRWNVYEFAKFVLFEYARVYLERDQEGDRQKAENLLNQALEIFQKVDAKKDIEKVIAKKKLLSA